MKKILSAFLLAFMICIIFCLPLSADNGIEYLFDDADIFTEHEQINIKETISKMSNDKVSYIIGTTNKYYYDREELAQEFCYEHDISLNDNVILLIIDVSTPSETHYDIYTYGNAWDKISDAEVDRIIHNDKVYDNLKSNNFSDGTIAFLKLAEKAYEGHLSMNLTAILLIAIISGVVIAVIVCICVVAKYKTKLKSASYPIDKYAKLELCEKQDIFLGSSVSRVRIQSSSNSGGGGRSGGGGHRGGA